MLASSSFQYNTNEISMATRSGVRFFENPGALSQSEVENYLREHSYLVHDWLIWSADKRTDRGWYFLEEADHFVVGYSPPVGPLRDQITFSDPVKACAEFVIRELDDFRQIFS